MFVRLPWAAIFTRILPLITVRHDILYAPRRQFMQESPPMTGGEICLLCRLLYRTRFRAGEIEYLPLARNAAEHALCPLAFLVVERDKRVVQHKEGKLPIIQRVGQRKAHRQRVQVLRAARIRALATRRTALDPRYLEIGVTLILFALASSTMETILPKVMSSL